MILLIENTEKLLKYMSKRLNKRNKSYTVLIAKFQESYLITVYPNLPVFWDNRHKKETDRTDIITLACFKLFSEIDYKLRVNQIPDRIVATVDGIEFTPGIYEFANHNGSERRNWIRLL